MYVGVLVISIVRLDQLYFDKSTKTTLVGLIVSPRFADLAKSLITGIPASHALQPGM
jgi:hypothetical protein